MKVLALVLGVLLVALLYFYMVSHRVTIQRYSDFSYTPGGIPRIIIKTSHYKRSEFPREMSDSLRKTQNANPGYIILYFDDDDVSEFMHDFSPALHELYKTLVPGAYKADFFRVCALYQYGGCYSDIGHTSLVSFDSICGDANVVLVDDMRERARNRWEYAGVHNALMCVPPRHPFLKMCIDAISEKIRARDYGEDWFDITGPTIIGKVFNCYFHNVCDNVNKRLLKPGITDYNGTRVKFLDLYEGYLTDGDKKVVLAKFDKYHEVMYSSKNIPKYGELWDARKVYQD